MRYALILSFIILGACAQDDKPQNETTCEIVQFTYPVKYPDNITRKSEVYGCSDGMYTVNSLTGDGETFRSDRY
jgi:hypothetical protein